MQHDLQQHGSQLSRKKKPRKRKETHAPSLPIILDFLQYYTQVAGTKRRYVEREVAHRFAYPNLEVVDTSWGLLQ